MLCNNILKLNKKIITNNFFKYFFLRNYGRAFSTKFDVSQFCTVNINCPYNINIRPIDVFKSQEKVLVNFDSNSSNLPIVKCRKDGDTVSVDVSANDLDGNHSLNIDTSVKANLNICGSKGDINIGSFYGRFIDIKSHDSNINLSKSQCEKISLISKTGNIICKDVIQAGDVILQTNSGNITTDRLQGLRLKVHTENGDIDVGSSYCDNSIFETDSGKLTLQNLHKRVMINIKHEGLLNMIGFDGELFIYIKRGLADIQLSKITNNSEVVMKDGSSLILRLSEECQKNNIIDILTGDYILSDTIKMDRKKSDNLCTLIPKNENIASGKLKVQCENSHVLVDSASWSEVFKASLKKRT